MNPLHFQLESGRVLLLEQPLTPAELKEAQTPQGMFVLECLADKIEGRATKELKEGDAAYDALIKKHIK